MTQHLWIEIPNWDSFQHYSTRDPIWIKTYTAQLDDPDYLTLTSAQRGLLHDLRLMFATTHRNLRLDTANISRRLNVRVLNAQLTALNHAGFLHLSASRPLATGYQPASAPRARARGREEKRREEPPYPHEVGEPETPKQQQTNPRALGTNPRAVAKAQAPRRRAEAWIRNGAADHVPPDRLAEVLEDEFKISDPDLLNELVTLAHTRSNP